MNATQLRAELVEAMAHAMYDNEVEPQWHGKILEEDDDVVAHYRELASAALTALLTKLGECGLKVVPVEATEEMVEAYNSSGVGDCWCNKAQQKSIALGTEFNSEIEKECARACRTDWSAMIAAAPELLQVEE